MIASSVPCILARGEILRLSNAAGQTIRLQSGRLWITQEDEGIDYIVEAGQAFTVRNRGLTVVSALRATMLAH